MFKGRNLKIVMLSTYPTGGAGWACYRLAEALRQQGHQVKLLTTHAGPEGLNWKVVAQPKVTRWRVYAMRLGLAKDYYRFRNRLRHALSSEFDWFSMPNSEYKVEDHADLEWADIIHLQWVADFIDMPRFFKRWAGRKPILWTLHDMNRLTGGCHYSGLCEGYKIGCPVCPQLPEGFDKTLAAQGFQIKLNVLDKIATTDLQLVALSTWMLKLMEESPLLSPFKRHRALNPVDATIFKPGQSPLRQRLNIPTGMKLLLFVADYTTNKRKGADLLAEALRLVTFPDGIEIGLMAVGEGDFGNILAGMSYYPLGKIDDAVQMAEAYQAANLFILPSRQDNLPNTVVEALACGLAVVGFNVGGVSDLIDDPTKGVLVNEVSAEALARGIEQALQTTYSNEAKADRFAYQPVANRYEEIYREILL